MNKKKLSTFLALGLTALAAAAGVASGATYHYSGYSCVPDDNTYSYRVANLVSAFGIENTSTTTRLDLACPLTAITATSGASITEYRVDYDDENSNATTGNLACQLIGRTANSSIVASTTKNSCATAGGCTSTSPTYTGYNYLSWTNPIGGTGLVNIYADCFIPTMVGGQGSHIVSHRVTY